MEFYDRLKQQLDQVHSWPSPYTFKFVVAADQQEALMALMPIGQVDLRPSKNGRYVAVSLKTVVEGSDQVLAVYQRASEISGIISL